jgi:kinetochore protein Nuf2
MASFIQDAQFGNARGSNFVPKQQFSFPLLKTDEIVKCLNELGIAVRQEELMDPENHKESCRRILECLAEICTGITKDELEQPIYAGTEAISHAELHDESIPKFNHFRACCKMMEICDVTDFSIKDVMSPVAARLRRHLSGIINFAKFREERLTLLSDLSTKREGLVAQLHQLREKNETLNNRAALLREQTAEESRIINTLEQECREIEASINAMNLQQNRLKEEAAQLRDTSSELKDTLVAKYAQQDELSALRKQLSLQIVSSPEKFRKQIVDVGHNLQNEQKEAKAAEKKAKELGSWVASLDEVHEEVSSAMEAVTELRGEVDRQKGVIGELDARRQATAAERVALSELSQRAVQAQRAAARAEEKLQQLRKQTQVRGRDAQLATEDLHKQLIEAEAFRMQVRAHRPRVLPNSVHNAPYSPCTGKRSGGAPAGRSGAPGAGDGGRGCGAGGAARAGLGLVLL